MGWAEFGNGDLLLEAEAQFNALVTTDQHLRYQQNLANRRLAILVLPFASGIVLQDEITLFSFHHGFLCAQPQRTYGHGKDD